MCNTERSRDYVLEGTVIVYQLRCKMLADMYADSLSKLRLIVMVILWQYDESSLKQDQW